MRAKFDQMKKKGQGLGDTNLILVLIAIVVILILTFLGRESQLDLLPHRLGPGLNPERRTYELGSNS